MIDIDELTNRILAIHRGELPPDAVTNDELREALAQQRARFAAGAEREATKKPASAKKASSGINFDFDFKM